MWTQTCVIAHVLGMDCQEQKIYKVGNAVWESPILATKGQVKSSSAQSTMVNATLCNH